MVTPNVVPCDQAAEIAQLIKDYSTTAEHLTKLGTRVVTMGDSLFHGWPGAAERMTSRELRHLGRFCTKLAKALDHAAAALGVYRDALADHEKAKTPDITVVNTKAVAAAKALVAASELIGKGKKASIDAAIARALPFQRDVPLVPGPGAKEPPLAATIGPKSKPADIRRAQEVLRARGWRVTVNGKWDAQTAGVVRQFQINKHVAHSGVVDKATWHAMWTKKIIW